MAVHFTDSKANASASAIKTPFLIEDILDRNSIKAGHKINFKTHADNLINPNSRNNGESSVNNQTDKNIRNNNEIQPSEDDYRKLLQSERYVPFYGNHLFAIIEFEDAVGIRC